MNSHPIRKPWGQRLWLTALHAGGVPAARPARSQSLAWGGVRNLRAGGGTAAL